MIAVSGHMPKAKVFVSFIFLPIPDSGVSYTGSPTCRRWGARATTGCTKTCFLPFTEEPCGLACWYVSVTHGATVVFTETLSCGLLSQLAGSRALYSSFAEKSAILICPWDKEEGGTEGFLENWEDKKSLSYSGKFHFVFSFCLLIQILRGLSAPSHVSAPNIPIPELLGQVSTAARGLRPLKIHSVHEELSLPNVRSFLEEKIIFLNFFFWREIWTFFTTGLETRGKETNPCSHSWMTSN